jgi:spoIIIJ-associated protein
MESPSTTPQRSTSVLTGVPPRDVLQKMLTLLTLPATVQQIPSETTTLLQVSTTESARLIGKRGQTLHQLQFLLNRMLHRANPDIPHVVIDCERYRERQYDDLLTQVRESAEKVHRWGEPVRVGPYSAPERRAILEHFERDSEIEIITDPGDESDRKKILIRLRAAKS